MLKKIHLYHSVMKCSNSYCCVFLLSLLNLHSVELNFNYSACERTGYTCLINEIFIVGETCMGNRQILYRRSKMVVYKNSQKLYYSGHSLGSSARIILTFVKIYQNEGKRFLFFYSPYYYSVLISLVYLGI